MPIIKEEEFNDENEFIRQLMDRNGVDRKFSCSSNESCASSTASSDYTFEHPFNLSIEHHDGKIELDQKKSYPSLCSSAAVEIQLSEQQQIKIQSILDSVQALTDAEKFFLFLKLPSKEQQSSVSLSNSKWEQTQAFQWIRNNLEECDSNINLPKHEVYDDYKLFCEQKGSKRFLSAPDFGKIVKCMFPNVKARRLGTRGHSKYCYSGLQRKSFASCGEKKATSNTAQYASNNTSCENYTEESVEQVFGAACKVVCEWANKLLGRCFNTLLELAKFLVNGSYVSTKSMSSFIVMSANRESLVQCRQSEPQKYKSLEEICTPSKTVMGSKPKQQQNITPSKIAQVVPVPSINNCPENKKNDISLDEFTIDVNAPVFLDEQSISNSKTDHSSEQVLMNNVNVRIKQEVFDSPSDPIYRPATPPLTPNRDERRQPQRNFPAAVPLTISNKTPKKIGRPSKNKSSPYASPNKPRIKHTGLTPVPHNFGQPLQTQPPINRFPVQNRLMPGFELQYHQQQVLFNSPVHPARQMGSPLPSCDNELQKFMNPQTPSHHQIINNNNRCQSVPISQKGSSAAFHPLTPQFHRNDRDQQHIPLNAKRNLNFIFDNPKYRDAVFSEPNGFNRPNPAPAVGQDHLVPSNQHQQMAAYPSSTTNQTTMNNQQNVIYDLGFPLNDLSTPEEMEDIPASLDNIDGDDLIKSLNHTNMTTWANDWSNSSMPFMNVNCR